MIEQRFGFHNVRLSFADTSRARFDQGLLSISPRVRYYVRHIHMVRSLMVVAVEQSTSPLRGG